MSRECVSGACGARRGHFHFILTLFFPPRFLQWPSGHLGLCCSFSKCLYVSVVSLVIDVCFYPLLSISVFLWCFPMIQSASWRGLSLAATELIPSLCHESQ